MVSASLELATGTLHTMPCGRHASQRQPLRDADAFEGVVSDPLTLHKYLYVNADPITRSDPTGHFSLAQGLAVTGIAAIMVSVLLPSVRGAWSQAYHVTAAGTRESIITAAFKGTATWEDWKRVASGFHKGSQAGTINVWDTLTFRQIDALHEYRNQMWREQGLDQSWVGTATNMFAWAGTAALYSAAAVWAWNAAGWGTMDIAVSHAARPYFIHVQYGANGLWKEAYMIGLRGSPTLSVQNVVGTQITGIPVWAPIAAMTAERAFSCVTAAIRAFGKGWGLP